MQALRLGPLRLTVREEVHNEMEELARKDELEHGFEDPICPCCGNVYEILNTKEEDDKISFSCIRCVSCGMYTEI